ncbi:hypothetical protein BEP19_04510 [Ammoniphilus oxalaticus]|uniref:DUF2621 domain-containing protein n=1 Tax=Ammoniphilus oxalaticus TaxID=66863 RepID=A0A419SLZ8_9BACL|nr:DUF2621 family protein [Ammoniphilus oxalaticus]RKD25088.1 hypothetical protein BEP19_04510 [Ammoniphilus oxalaticus]
MSSIFGSFIVFWMFGLAFIMMIGGFFMFRKFLKSMPKQDGKSELDWQDYYIDQTRALWSEEGLQLLNELVHPVPELFRDVARRTIAAKIGKLAIEENAESIDQNLIIKGYIIATPARDHRFLVKTLKEKQIDFSPFREHLKIKV